MNYYGKALVVTAMFALTACQAASKPDATDAAPALNTDTCGASQYQHYVGQPLSALEDQHFEQKVRTIPWRSVTTLDYRLDRLNFKADKDGKISDVYCG